MICENQWEGCYNDSWMGDIVPESFAHPAKYSRGLIHLIYQHAKEMGWVKAWDVVIDPFGGVALGGLDAMGMGLHWIGVELEEKFVSLGEQNIELWNRQLRGWHTLGTAKIIQGDSRKIKDVIEKADLICISPPLANMKEGDIDIVVSSPPFESSILTKDKKFISAIERDQRHGSRLQGGNKNGYGDTKDNLGNQSGDTFWQASKEIAQGCFDLLKPGGHAIWVCKDYIKAGKRAPFSQNWAALCESVGFEIVCWHQAMLVKKHGIQITLDYEDESIVTERKSFFRRLAEKKGSPKIDWEDILCMKKRSVTNESNDG